MRVIALTGTAAAGKSTVAAIWRAEGAIVLDADAMVHELQAPGQPVLTAIIAAFGDVMLNVDGSLDRARLRRHVLGDPAARTTLESIVHPALEQRRRAALHDAAAHGVELIAVEIPLLFEAADPGAYDGVVVVDAPEHERRRRLIVDRGMSAHEADQLIAAQLPASEKRARATWVIDNDGNRDRLAERARLVWERVRR
jgi:dephospho-CoA kinase